VKYLLPADDVSRSSIAAGKIPVQEGENFWLTTTRKIFFCSSNISRVIMSLTKFAMQPTLHLHRLYGFTCIVGCIANFVRFIITCESPCIYNQFQLDSSFMSKQFLCTDIFKFPVNRFTSPPVLMNSQ
jgi:hypothetical protein